MESKVNEREIPCPQPTLCLTRQELEQLTGCVRPGAMCRWLESKKYIFEPGLRPGDFPRVARAYFERRMVAGGLARVDDAPPVLPDFNAFMRRAANQDLQKAK